MKTSAHKVWIPPEKISGDKAHIMINQKPEKWQTKTSNSRRQLNLLLSKVSPRKLIMYLTTKKKRLIQSSMKSYKAQRGDSYGLNQYPRIFNICVVLIVWVLSLAVVPKLFNSPYQDNAYYLLELSLITFLSLSIGISFLSDTRTWIVRFFRFVTFANACWYGIGVIGEVINLFDPEIVVNTFFNDNIWYRIAFVFEIGVIGSLYYERKRSKA